MNVRVRLLSEGMHRSALFVLAAVTFAGQPMSDRFGDGTPDFMRLEDSGDRDAFRRWFTVLAELEFFNKPSARPTEIVDCSALIRFAYREALRSHDSAWAAASGLPVVPALPSIAKYSWPHTPMGASLFRVRAGSFMAEDIRNGAFSQFANVSALQRYNTFFVGRDVARARHGDLLFYYRPDHRSQFHSMIVIGRSQIKPSAEIVVVYDTGPEGDTPGTIRRRTVDEMLHYPDPQWRPQANNPAFLGVYRWNILRDDGF